MATQWASPENLNPLSQIQTFLQTYLTAGQPLSQIEDNSDANPSTVLCRMSEPEQTPAEDAVEISVFNFQLSFPRVALKALAAGRSWQGRVSCSIMGAQKESRQKSIDRDAQCKAYELPEDAMAVVTHWNEHPAILTVAMGLEDGRVETRNLPFSKSVTKSTLALFKKVLSEFSVEFLTHAIDCYLEKCQLGKNYVKQNGSNRNLAYKDLNSFLVKLIAVKQTGAYCWWMDEDDSVKLTDKHYNETLQISVAYARRFLRMDGVSSINAKDWRSLMRFGEALRVVGEKYPWTWDQLIKQGFDAAEQYFDFQTEKALYPGHLGSDRFLTIGLPNYLRNKLV